MKSHAKVNLTLEITEKRSDGYHNLDSIFASVIELFDIMSIQTNDTGAINISCTDPNVPTDEKNTVWKVVEYLKKEYSITEGFDIEIVKNIPLQSGLGGASSNAATVAKWIAGKYGITLDMEKISKIGADIPYFLVGGFCRVKGIGEQVKRINTDIVLNAWLVKPKQGISTGEAFKNAQVLANGTTELAEKALIEGNEKVLVVSMYNGFNVLNDVKQDLLNLGFEKVILTGSGSTFICIGEPNDVEKNKYELFKKVRIGVIPDE